MQVKDGQPSDNVLHDSGQRPGLVILLVEPGDNSCTVDDGRAVNTVDIMVQGTPGRSYRFAAYSGG